MLSVDTADDYGDIVGRIKEIARSVGSGALDPLFSPVWFALVGNIVEAIPAQHVGLWAGRRTGANGGVAKR